MPEPRAIELGDIAYVIMLPTHATDTPLYGYQEALIYLDDERAKLRKRVEELEARLAAKQDECDDAAVREMGAIFSAHPPVSSIDVKQVGANAWTAQAIWTDTIKHTFMARGDTRASALASLAQTLVDHLEEPQR